MGAVEKARFFDALAPRWDALHDLEDQAVRLGAGLEELGVGADEVVLDLGCGTGNLTRALLSRLSPEGRVAAVDLSSTMVATARRKISDRRVEWHVADAVSLPLADACLDRAVCCAVWPHLDDPEAAARELGRVLRPGGRCHVWHLAPRRRINEIHAAGGEAIERDLLAPGEETAATLAAAGLAPTMVIDDDSRYLVTAIKR